MEIKNNYSNMTSEDDGYFKGIQYTTLLCTFIQAPRKIIINLSRERLSKKEQKELRKILRIPDIYI